MDKITKDGLTAAGTALGTLVVTLGGGTLLCTAAINHRYAVARAHEAQIDQQRSKMDTLLANDKAAAYQEALKNGVLTVNINGQLIPAKCVPTTSSKTGCTLEIETADYQRIQKQNIDHEYDQKIEKALGLE